jgi:hypothetical protein
VLALWNSPRQREAYSWFTVELANLRTAFRWAADHDDLDSAAAIAVCATILGTWVEQFEPVSWAEEIVEPARRVEHRRLAQLYVMAARRYTSDPGNEATAHYAQAGLQAVESERFDPVPFEFASELGGIYILEGEPDRWIEMCRNIIASSADPHILTRTYLAITLTMVGAEDEAIEVSDDLRNVAGSTENPALNSFALLAYGYARHNSDPVGAYDAHRLGAKIARESGNRLLETYAVGNMSRLAARHGDPAETFDLIAVSIRNYSGAGNYSLLPQTIAVLATYLDSLGYYESAATLSGFATTTFARSYFPEIADAITHLREALGDAAYESLAHAGKSMTSPAMATYALEQIALARADLLRAGESS